MDVEGLVEEIATIARIPAPTFEEAARLDWIEQRLAGAPGVRRRDAAGNLVWRWGEGPPRLLVAAHVDTVFPRSTALAIRREGDRLVGPGVGDNAAAVAVAIAVVEELLESRTPAPGAVVFTVGEEGLGNLRGALHACRELRPQAAIALEGHGLESVIVDAVGSLRARLAVSGPGGHAWADRGSPSAIHALVALAAGVLADSEPDATVNIGLIEGGLAVNAIAPSAAMVLEKRSLEPADLEAMARHLRALGCPAPLELSVEILGERPAGRLPRDSQLLATVLAVRDGLGLPATLDAGSTDANAALGLGIPALALGVSSGSRMHTLEEAISIPTLVRGAAQARQVLVTMLAS